MSMLPLVLKASLYYNLGMHKHNRLLIKMISNISLIKIYPYTFENIKDMGINGRTRSNTTY